MELWWSLLWPFGLMEYPSPATPPPAPGVPEEAPEQAPDAQLPRSICGFRRGLARRPGGPCVRDQGCSPPRSLGTICYAIVLPGRTSAPGPYFGQSLAGRASKSALLPASGWPEVMSSRLEFGRNLARKPDYRPGILLRTNVADFGIVFSVFIRGSTVGLFLGGSGPPVPAISPRF